MAPLLVCSVCGGRTFRARTYRSPRGECPAVECTACGAIMLDEAVADSSAERVKVREMISARGRLHARREG